MNHRCIRSRGFTLAETVFASAILAIGGVAGLNAAGAAVTAARDAYNHAAAQDLARDLLGEINQRPAFAWSTAPTFDQAATEPALGSKRSVWTHATDFHGITNSPPEDESGVAAPGFGRWTRSARLAWVSDDLSESKTATDILRVTVTVSFNGEMLEELVSYRSRAGDEGWFFE